MLAGPVLGAAPTEITPTFTAISLIVTIAPIAPTALTTRARPQVSFLPLRRWWVPFPPTLDWWLRLFSQQTTDMLELYF
jgi:hypothetical protein